MKTITVLIREDGIPLSATPAGGVSNEEIIDSAAYMVAEMLCKNESVNPRLVQEMLNNRINEWRDSILIAREINTATALTESFRPAPTSHPEDRK